MDRLADASAKSSRKHNTGLQRRLRFCRLRTLGPQEPTVTPQPCRSTQYRASYQMFPPHGHILIPCDVRLISILRGHYQFSCSVHRVFTSRMIRHSLTLLGVKSPIALQKLGMVVGVSASHSGLVMQGCQCDRESCVLKPNVEEMPISASYPLIL